MTSRHYCFTIFEGHLLHTPEWDGWTETPKDVRYIVWQMEKCKETGNVHLQGYIEFTRSVTIETAQVLMGVRANLAIRRGTRDQARNYCMKEDTRIDGPWEVGKWVEGGQGSRNDLRKIKEIIDEGGNILDCYEENFGSMVRFGRGIEKYAFLRRSKDKKYKPKTIIVITGPTRTGKSRAARAELGDEFFQKPSDEWFDGYDNEKNVLMEDFCWQQMSINQFLVATDNYPCPVKIKTSFAWWAAEKIIITSNEDVSDWWPNAPQWQRDAVQARITEKRSTKPLVEVGGNNIPPPKKVVPEDEISHAEEWIESLSEPGMELPTEIFQYFN